MLRLILVYATSTGMQRAIVFLAAPLLARGYPVEAVGVYTLVQTVGQLVIPLLSLNCTVALMREALEQPVVAHSLLRLVYLAAAAGALIAGAAALIPHVPGWIALGLALGAMETAFTASISVLQGREKPMAVFGLSAAKMAGLLAVIFGALVLHLPIETLLLLQIGNSLLSALAAYVVASGMLASRRGPWAAKAEIVSAVRYSAATLPHTTALWISAASDRLVLGSVHGKAEVGSYALAFTAAQLVMLAVTGVISALPPRVARDPENWRDPRYVIRFFSLTSAGCFCLILVALGCVFVNERIYELVPNMPDNATLLVALIGVGFYCTLYYVFFAAYMFLNRSTGALSRAGLVIGPLNLAIMFGLVSAFGAVGAATGVIVSYLMFGLAYARAALRLEPTLRQVLAPLALQTVALLCLSLAAAWVLG